MDLSPMEGTGARTQLRKFQQAFERLKPLVTTPLTLSWLVHLCGFLAAKLVVTNGIRTSVGTPEELGRTFVAGYRAGRESELRKMKWGPTRRTLQAVLHDFRENTRV